MGFRPAFLGFHNNPLHCTAPTTSYLLPPTSYLLPPITVHAFSSPLLWSALRSEMQQRREEERRCCVMRLGGWEIWAKGNGQWAMGRGNGWIDR